MTTSDALLTRIERICNYYRGASWQLHFDSDDGGFWSLKLTNPPTDEVEEQPAQMMHQFFYGHRSESPIFAIRCQELEVVAEAIEHWHASVLSREPR